MSIQPPPSGRVAIGVMQTPSGPVEIFATMEWSMYFESLNSLAVQTATGPGGLADVNADDTWHDDLNARESVLAIDEIRNEISSLRTDSGALRSSLDAIEAVVADYRPASAQAVASPGGGLPVVAGASVLSVPSIRGGVFEHEEVILAAGVAIGMRVFLSIAPHSDADENNEREISLTTISGEAGAGVITARLSFFEQTSGPIRINYLATP